MLRLVVDVHAAWISSCRRCRVREALWVGPCKFYLSFFSIYIYIYILEQLIASQLASTMSVDDVQVI